MIDVFRPNDPLPFLANYMLNNKTSIKDIKEFINSDYILDKKTNINKNEISNNNNLYYNEDVSDIDDNQLDNRK